MRNPEAASGRDLISSTVRRLVSDNIGAPSASAHTPPATSTHDG
jgi:hypothetical protein